MNNLNNGQGSFGYHGEVTIKLKQGKYVHTIPATHNHGLSYLFESLCKLFAGEIEPKALVPARVALYSFKSEAKSADDWVDLVNNDNIVAASTLHPIYEKKVTTVENSPKAVLQGKIQFGSISSNQVNAMALFPITASSSTDFSRALAFYKFVDSDGNLAPISIDRTSLDDSFIFEWQMDFSNK